MRAEGTLMPQSRPAVGFETVDRLKAEGLSYRKIADRLKTNFQAVYRAHHRVVPSVPSVPGTPTALERTIVTGEPVSTPPEYPSAMTCSCSGSMPRTNVLMCLKPSCGRWNNIRWSGRVSVHRVHQSTPPRVSGKRAAPSLRWTCPTGSAPTRRRTGGRSGKSSTRRSAHS
jgi:hypothetical protein